MLKSNFPILSSLLLHMSNFSSPIYAIRSILIEGEMFAYMGVVAYMCQFTVAKQTCESISEAFLYYGLLYMISNIKKKVWKYESLPRGRYVKSATSSVNASTEATSVKLEITL